MPVIGTVGGILCAWNPVYIDRREEIIGKFSISVILKDFSTSWEWIFTGIYGLVVTTNREDFWVELQGLRDRWLGLWLVGSDFNVIYFVQEKSFGGRTMRSMRDFEDVV